MIDVKVIEEKLYSYNMLMVEEDNNKKLMDRISSMLKCDMNNYQRQVLVRAIEEIKIIKSA